MSQIESTEFEAGTVARAVGDSRRLAGVFFFLLAAQFMTVIMLGAAMVPGYDFNQAAISDLGVFAETAVLFNVSLVVVGLFNLLGGYFFYRIHGARWLAALFALAGVGAAGAGVVPLDNPTGLHGLFALLAFVFFNVQAIGTATRLAGPMKAISVLAGVLGLAFVVLMALGDGGNAALFGPIGHGGTERMIVYPPMVWLIAFGGYLMAAGADDPVASRTGGGELAE
ncbi:DUF998 domain-containing protein [Halobacteriaceae archaeon GCM10025711]